MSITAKQQRTKFIQTTINVSTKCSVESWIPNDTCRNIHAVVQINISKPNWYVFLACFTILIPKSFSYSTSTYTRNASSWILVMRRSFLFNNLFLERQENEFILYYIIICISVITLLFHLHVCINQQWTWITRKKLLLLCMLHSKIIINSQYANLGISGIEPSFFSLVP